MPVPNISPYLPHYSTDGRWLTREQVPGKRELKLAEPVTIGGEYKLAEPTPAGFTFARMVWRQGQLRCSAVVQYLRELTDAEHDRLLYADYEDQDAILRVFAEVAA